MRFRAPRSWQASPEAPRFEWPPLRITLAIAGGLAVLVGLGLLALPRRTTGEWRSGVVTVESHVGGGSGRSGNGPYNHRVRLPDGTHGTITLRELVARDERLRVDYARTDGGLLFRTPIRCGDRPDC